MQTGHNNLIGILIIMKTCPCTIKRTSSDVKIEKKKGIFNIIAQNIDHGYTLERSNEYPQSMFWSKKEENRNTPAYPSFSISKGLNISRTFS